MSIPQSLTCRCGVSILHICVRERDSCDDVLIEVKALIGKVFSFETKDSSPLFSDHEQQTSQKQGNSGDTNPSDPGGPTKGLTLRLITNPGLRMFSLRSRVDQSPLTLTTRQLQWLPQAVVVVRF